MSRTLNRILGILEKNEKTVDLLVKYIPKVGFNVPLVLDRNNVIVKGL